MKLVSYSLCSVALLCLSLTCVACQPPLAGQEGYGEGKGITNAVQLTAAHLSFQDKFLSALEAQGIPVVRRDPDYGGWDYNYHNPARFDKRSTISLIDPYIGYQRFALHHGGKVNAADFGRSYANEVLRIHVEDDPKMSDVGYHGGVGYEDGQWKYFEYRHASRIGGHVAYHNGAAPVFGFHGKQSSTALNWADATANFGIIVHGNYEYEYPFDEGWVRVAKTAFATMAALSSIRSYQVVGHNAHRYANLEGFTEEEKKFVQYDKSVTACPGLLSDYIGTLSGSAYAPAQPGRVDASNSLEGDIQHHTEYGYGTNSDDDDDGGSEF